MSATSPQQQQPAPPPSGASSLPPTPTSAPARDGRETPASPRTPALPDDHSVAERDARALQQPEAIENSQQFLEWFQKVEAHMERDQEHSHRMYGELLREYRCVSSARVPAARKCGRGRRAARLAHVPRPLPLPSPRSHQCQLTVDEIDKSVAHLEVKRRAAPLPPASCSRFSPCHGPPRADPRRVPLQPPFFSSPRR